MLKIQYILRLTTVLLVLTNSATGQTSETLTTRTLTVSITSPRPLPMDLVPLLYDANLAGEILRFKSYRNQTVIEMKSIAPSTFTGEIAWNQPSVALAIDHPGYLRGYSTTLLLSESTTHTIKLPLPGRLCARLVLKYIRGSHRPHYADAKGHCITSSLTRQTSSTYEISNPVLPLPDWGLSYDDLAPGIYRIFAVGRNCFIEGEEPAGGPAGTAGDSEFTVKSEHLTELGIPIFTRGDFKKIETTSPTVSITPLSTSTPLLAPRL